MDDHHARTLHALEMILAAEALTSGTSDDHQRRVLARQVYVFVGAFLDTGSAWRKNLARTGATPRAVNLGKRRLQALRRNYDKTKDVRDFLAAKRQPTTAARGEDADLTLELWTSISADRVTKLVVLACEAFDALVDAAGVGAPSPAIAPVPEDVPSALRTLLPKDADDHLVVSTGSYAWARPGAMGVQIGGELGRRIAQVNDIDDQLRTAVALWPTARGVQPYERLVRSAILTELSALLDLSIGPPEPYPVKVSPLVELCTDDGRQDGATLLNQFREAFSLDLRRWIKESRNAFGAHVEIARPFAALAGDLDGYDVDDVINVVDAAREWLEAAALYEQALRPLLWDGRVMASFSRPETPAPAPYAGTAKGVLKRPDPGSLLDSPNAVFVDDMYVAAGVAGALAGRQRQLAEKFGIELVEHEPTTAASASRTPGASPDQQPAADDQAV